MIRGKYLSANDDLSQVINIRNTVMKTNITDINPMAMNVLVYEEEKAVAAGTIIYDTQIFSIENISVLKEYQNKGYGEFTLRLLADKALLAGAKYVELTATPETLSFFKKYEFKSTSSDNDDLHMKLDLSELKKPCGGSCH